MPIGFILLGVILIYNLFFFSYKILSVLLTLPLLICYFVPNVYFFNYGINVALIFGVVSLFIVMFFKNKNYSFVTYSIIVNFAYLIIVKLNSNYLTILNPTIVFIMLLVFGLFINNNAQIIHYFVTSLVLLIISNCFLEQTLQFVLIGDLNLFNYVVLACFISLAFNQIKKYLKVFQRRRAWKKFCY